MIQPAGYIRIITEELTENNRPVFREAVPRIEHVAVGLPLLHLRKPAPGDPDKGIEPEEAAHQFERDAFGGVAVAHMARLVADHDLAAAAFVTLTQKYRPQKRKGRPDARILRHGICAAIGDPRTAAQTSDPEDAHGKDRKRHRGGQQVQCGRGDACHASPVGGRGRYAYDGGRLARLRDERFFGRRDGL